jgi:hypothetical protein
LEDVHHAHETLKEEEARKAAELAMSETKQKGIMKKKSKVKPAEVQSEEDGSPPVKKKRRPRASRVVRR